MTVLEIPEADLPIWMRYARQTIDWGVFLVIGLGMLISWPLILRDDLPRTNAIESYVFMAEDYARAFDEGRLYPRWTAAALNGYGAPIPHYFPPGIPYSAAFIKTMFTNDTVLAVRIMGVVALSLSGAVVYAFVMRWLGAGAGVLASVLYLYSPYVGLQAPYILGDLPGVMAHALLPALLWSINRLMLVNRQFDFAFVAFVTSALILTDVQAAFVGAFFVCGLLLWYGLTYRRFAPIRSVGLAIFIGLGLSSFFWLPALWEADAVRWRPPPYEPVQYMLQLSQLFAHPSPVDLNEMVQTPQFSVGLTTLIAAILGMLTVLRFREGRGLLLLFAFTGSCLILVALWWLPDETWLVGPITLCLSIVGGALLRWRYWLPERLTLTIAVALLLILAYPTWLVPAWTNVVGNVTPSDQILHEKNGFGVAVLPPGSSVPVTIPDGLPSSQVLINSYNTDNVIRISNIRSGQSIDLIRGRSHHDIYQVELEALTEVNFLRAGFPGWRAELNGRDLDLLSDPTTGLIQVAVPPTSLARLQVSLQSTAVRRLAWWMSGLCLLVLIFGIVRRVQQMQDLYYDDLRFLPREESRLLGIVYIGFVVAILTFGNPQSAYTLHFRPGHRLDNTLLLRNPTGVGMEAISYEINGTEFRLGDTLELRLYWRTLGQLFENYQIRISLRDSNQSIAWLPGEPDHPGGYPTKQWIRNFYMQDNHSLMLSSGLRPGMYQVAVEVLLCEPDCINVEFFNNKRESIGTMLLLPSLITVGM